MKDKQDIINTLLACMDYNKKDDTWYIKANRIDNLAKDLEGEFNNIALSDVSNSAKKAIEEMKIGSTQQYALGNDDAIRKVLRLLNDC